MGERLVTLLRYEHPDQAIMFQELLENEGIRVVVTDERPEDGDPADALPGVGTGVLLQVPESEAKRAAEILQEEFDHELFD
jgi:hypothetical protein